MGPRTAPRLGSAGTQNPGRLHEGARSLSRRSRGLPGGGRLGGPLLPAAELGLSFLFGNVVGAPPARGLYT